MQKIAFLVLFLIAVLAFSACVPAVQEEKVASTQVNEDLFDAHEVPVEALPFLVTLPNGWNVREEEFLYTFVFDEGASGYIQVNKQPVEGGAIGCREIGNKKYCTVDAGGVLYSVVVNYKTMNAARHAEAEAILESMQ